MEEAQILLVPWRAKSFLVSTRVFFFSVILATIFLLITIIMALSGFYMGLPFALLCGVFIFFSIISLFIVCYFKYQHASKQVVYIFTEEKLWIEKRVYNFMPTLKFLFARGVLDKNDHTNSCNTLTYELCFLVDPGEDNDVHEKKSQFWKGISLIDRKWDYTYDRYTHKSVQLKNIRKVDWDKNVDQISEWISQAKKNIGRRQ